MNTPFRTSLPSAQRLAACALGAVAITLAGAPAVVSAQAGAPVVYPAKGQSAHQQDQDKFQCYGWAKGQTGFDPMQAPPPDDGAARTTNASKNPNAGLVRSAAMGAAVGELAHHDAGRGAAAGVVGSAVIDGVRQRQTVQAQQQRTAQQQAARKQQQQTFDRAFGACMEARGYAVR
jgi:hypothetical protein